MAGSRHRPRRDAEKENRVRPRALPWPPFPPGALPLDQPQLVRVPTLGLARVRGRSMEPTLHEGDRLLVLYGVRPRLGRLALVRLPDDDRGVPRPLAVKRVTRPAPDGADGWWVERDNPREGVDSWLVGPIPTRDVRGVVVLRLPGFLRIPHRRREQGGGGVG